jgi:hypothetical protein
MKKIIISFLFIATTFYVSAQKAKVGGSTGSTTSNTGNSGSTLSNFTNDEAGSAIKEALTKGVSNAVDVVSLKDGYFKNNLIKIPFPPEVKTVETTLRQVGAGKIVDKVVVSLNRAAEDAAKAAKPIFINSIKQLTVTDAMNIVTGSQQDAATNFLKRTTNDQLLQAFKPAIKKSLDKTYATKYWREATTRYNRIPLVKKVNTDLTDYTTRKALDGLFIMIAKEENKIRQDPKAFGSNVIDKVFGGLLGK